MFRIKKFVHDTCPLKDKVNSQRQATNNFVGGIIKPKQVDHKGSRHRKIHKLMLD